MKPITLNELPAWSAWPERLLGISEWNTPARTPEKVEREYNRDKYAQCLQFLGANPDATVEDVKLFEFGGLAARELCVSRGNDLYLAALDEARSSYYQLLIDTMRASIEASASVVELGCGYGFNLWKLSTHFPDKRFVGGEFSTNAVELAGRLFTNGAADVRVQGFDFYDPDYTILDDLPAPVVVFTSHALEQLPSAAPFVQGIARHLDNIATVYHFEPVHELHDHSLLGLMRKRYADVNDYNRDLLTQLKQGSVGKVVRVEGDVFGLNPLNPTSVIEWRA